MKEPNWRVFTERFGEKVRDAGITCVPRLLLKNLGRLGLKPVEALVVIELISCWGPERKHPFPSRGTLWGCIGCDKRRLDCAIRRLVKMELVKKVKQVGQDGRQASNSYDLSGLIDRLKRLRRPIRTVGVMRPKLPRKASTAPLSRGMACFSAPRVPFSLDSLRRLPSLAPMARIVDVDVVDVDVGCVNVRCAA